MDTIPGVEHSSESRGGAALAKAVVAFLAGRYKSVSACVFLILPIFALAGCWHSQTAFNLPNPRVLLALPVQQNLEVHSGWVATLYPNAEIRSQGSRYIVSQDYRQGPVVRNDEVLFAIDPQPFQANLDCAKGELAQGGSHAFAWFLQHSRRYFVITGAEPRGWAIHECAVRSR